MLLPSQELRDLAEDFDICLSGKQSPKGCDIRFRQFYWLLSFDRKGELLAAFRLGDELTALKGMGMSIPKALLAIADRSKKATPSLEELERRYVQTRGSQDAHNAILKKLKALAGVGQMRVAAFMKKCAAKTKDPGRTRARGILIATQACDRQVINHGAYAALRRSIEEFVDAHPTHPSCKDLVVPLCDVGLKYGFDLSAKCEAYAKRWRSRPNSSDKEKASLAALAKQLLSHRDAELESVTQKLQNLKPKQPGSLRLIARLGRADETLAGLERGRSFGVMKPIHAEWRREAAAKKGR